MSEDGITPPGKRDDRCHLMDVLETNACALQVLLFSELTLQPMKNKLYKLILRISHYKYKTSLKEYFKDLFSL